MTSDETESSKVAALAPSMDQDLIRTVGLALLPWAVGLVLAGIFWWPLLFGAGFIGGDTYIYYFPFKQFYAEGLSQNEIWFWNPRIGNGVPVLGESQTGVFYPFNLLAYRFLDLDRAYSVVFLVHYLLAYVFTYWLARALSLRPGASLLCALVFVYGWFPARSCLEWAIVTGAWMPLVMLAAYRWLQTGKIRWAWLIAVTQFIQLLAGHFQLAFVTDITVCLFALLNPITGERWNSHALRRLAVPLFLACGFALAAFQLLPTWELRGLSQRGENGATFDLEYGYLPIRYLTQVILPWSIYPTAEAHVSQYKNTNMIEAHFYVGLLTLALLVRLPFARNGTRPLWPWIVLIVLGLVLATAVALPILRHLPGFNFFRSWARYALMSQLGLAILAADSMDRLFTQRIRLHYAVLIGIFALTTRDLLWVARQVRYVSIIRPAAVNLIPNSVICERLGPMDRVLAPAGNLLALSGAACVPPYLGMGPAEYFKLWNWEQNVFAGQLPASPERIALLQAMGVTHVLTEVPLPEGWPVRNVYTGYDEFLHRGLARQPFQPFFLYEMDPQIPRAYLRDNAGQRITGGNVKVTHFQPHHVALEVTSPSAGELVLTDLMYPGWTATIDGVAAEPVVGELFRILPITPGTHTIHWNYVPHSFYRGLVIAGAALGMMGLGSVVYLTAKRRTRADGERRFWHQM